MQKLKRYLHFHTSFLALVVILLTRCIDVQPNWHKKSKQKFGLWSSFLLVPLILTDNNLGNTRSCLRFAKKIISIKHHHFNLPLRGLNKSVTLKKKVELKIRPRGLVKSPILQFGTWSWHYGACCGELPMSLFRWILKLQQCPIFHQMYTSEIHDDKHW